VTFENGDRYAPVWIGYWNAIPAGRGSLPHNSKTGTEVPWEALKFSKDLYPNAQVLGRSAEGNGIWFEDSSDNGKYHGGIFIEDSQGKFLKMTFIRPGEDYTPNGGTLPTQGSGSGGKWSGSKTWRKSEMSGRRSKIDPSGELSIGSEHFQLSAKGTANGTRSTEIEHRSGSMISSDKSFSGKWNQKFVGSFGNNVTQTSLDGRHSLQASTFINSARDTLTVPQRW
jgi:hypothetical protein